MNFRNKYCFIWVACMGVLSCNNIPSKTHGPIKLGDTADIVTEKDSRRLQDLVIDLKPDIPSSTTQADTPVMVAKPAADTSKKQTTTVQAPPPPAALPAGAGLKAEFKDVAVFIPNITAKLSGNANLMNANGAVYTWVSGNLPGNVLHTTGNTTKVSQRYQSVIILRTKNGDLPLESLMETNDWKQLNGSNGAYPITGIAENQLEYSDAKGSELRNAVMKAARSRRYSNKKTQEWVAALGNARTANQKPLVVVLRSLMWKIDGKNAQGKMFSKQIRIDVPL